METRANASEQDITKANISIPGGIAGEVHENTMQEKLGKRKFHPFLEEKIHPFILNIYKDYSVSGYFLMIAVSFIAIAIVVGILMGIYWAVSN
jgi:hypothetical protein